MAYPYGALPYRSQIDITLIKVLAHAFRRKRMLESGDFTTIKALAVKAVIAPT